MNDLGPIGFIAVALFPTVCVASCDSRLTYSQSVRSNSNPRPIIKLIFLIVAGVLLLILMVGMSMPTKHLSSSTPPAPATVLHDATDLCYTRPANPATLNSAYKV